MKNSFYKIYCLLISLFFISACTSLPIVNYVRSGHMGILGPIGFFIGCCLAWYCWVEAKRKNRNEWLWLILGILFGFIPLIVLVYLKDLPIGEKQVQKDAKKEKAVMGIFSRKKIKGFEIKMTVRCKKCRKKMRILKEWTYDAMKGAVCNGCGAHFCSHCTFQLHDIAFVCCAEVRTKGVQEEIYF